MVRTSLCGFLLNKILLPFKVVLIYLQQQGSLALVTRSGATWSIYSSTVIKREAEKRLRPSALETIDSFTGHII